MKKTKVETKVKQTLIIELLFLRLTALLIAITMASLLISNLLREKNDEVIKETNTHIIVKEYHSKDIWSKEQECKILKYPKPITIKGKLIEYYNGQNLAVLQLDNKQKQIIKISPNFDDLEINKNYLLKYTWWPKRYQGYTIEKKLK